MSKETATIALDGKAIFFDSFGNPIPKYCTYYGSDKLTEGKISGYGEIRCLNCGMDIHDCCSQNHISYLLKLREERSKKQ